MKNEKHGSVALSEVGEETGDLGFELRYTDMFRFPKVELLSATRSINENPCATISRSNIPRYYPGSHTAPYCGSVCSSGSARPLSPRHRWPTQRSYTQTPTRLYDPRPSPRSQARTKRPSWPPKACGHARIAHAARGGRPSVSGACCFWGFAGKGEYIICRYACSCDI